MINIHELTPKKISLILTVFFIVQILTLIVLVLIFLRVNSLNKMFTSGIRNIQMQRQMQNNGGLFGGSRRGSSQLQIPDMGDPLQGL